MTANSVMHLDLQLRGLPVIQTLRQGSGRGSQKNFFFRPFGLHFALKKGVGGGGGPPGLLPWALLLDLPLELACVAGGILAGKCGTQFLGSTALPSRCQERNPEHNNPRQLGRLTATRAIKGGKLVAKLMHSTGFDLWTYHFSHMGKNIVLSLIGQTSFSGEEGISTNICVQVSR